jgi:hypothetical protein
MKTKPFVTCGKDTCTPYVLLLLPVNHQCPPTLPSTFLPHRPELLSSNPSGGEGSGTWVLRGACVPASGGLARGGRSRERATALLGMSGRSASPDEWPVRRPRRAQAGKRPRERAHGLARRTAPRAGGGLARRGRVDDLASERATPQAGGGLARHGRVDTAS